ncbi:MAG TPA: adenylate/guanylate cyclase domain-containing protein [Nitrososphaera sp.]|jgi:class 3 adenylate cyclase|nr:adenylate/guanylate cyclase domain-containing protein [Nitrososphaera sp.]
MRRQRTTPIDTRTIVKESQKRIKKALVEGFEYHHLAIAKSDQFLRKHTSQRLDFAVMYVDLVGSTRLSTELAPDFLSKIVTVFSQEVSHIIEYFGGLVLKFVGDASIGYFPSSQNLDDVVLCGESVVLVVRNAINPLLLQMGHAGIEVKVTSDYGQHTVVRYGSDRERSHVDIISATMNLAAKMQSVTKGSQMVIGNSLYGKLSYEFRQIFEKANLEQIKWDYHNLAEQKPYQLYIATF